MLGRFVSSAIQAVLDNPVAMERANKLMLMRTKQCLECRLELGSARIAMAVADVLCMVPSLL